MAVVNNGTVNALPEDRIPAGYTRPTVTTISDFHWRYDTVVTVAVSGTVASTATATMSAIVTGTSSAVTTILNADFLGTATVTAYSVINDLTTNFAPSLNNTSMSYLLSATTNSYLVSVTIYVKAV